mmetsp:Transcript_67186/g.212736  ORF Transcript_67186/g.212736 Transcript_67186/m.212736 type:complete len:338 (-) Transcript_67186:36-1049(-)
MVLLPIGESSCARGGMWSTKSSMRTLPWVGLPAASLPAPSRSRTLTAPSDWITRSHVYSRNLKPPGSAEAATGIKFRTSHGPLVCRKEGSREPTGSEKLRRRGRDFMRVRATLPTLPKLSTSHTVMWSKLAGRSVARGRAWSSARVKVAAALPTPPWPVHDPAARYTVASPVAGCPCCPAPSSLNSYAMPSSTSTTLPSSTLATPVADSPQAPVAQAAAIPGHRASKVRASTRGLSEETEGPVMVPLGPACDGPPGLPGTGTCARARLPREARSSAPSSTALSVRGPPLRRRARRGWAGDQPAASGAGRAAESGMTRSTQHCLALHDAEMTPIKEAL